MAELSGTLHWNEFEGGFWSLDPDDRDAFEGRSPVLVGFTPPEGAGDGSRVVVTGEPAAEQVDFLMAGPRFEVTGATLRGA